jgi:hypothetical protein
MYLSVQYIVERNESNSLRGQEGIVSVYGRSARKTVSSCRISDDVPGLHDEDEDGAMGLARIHDIIRVINSAEQ